MRVLGPEFPTEESRKVFLRIEESVEQYSTHSRESVWLIRNPFALTHDHLVLLWSHGGAIVEFVPYGGKIIGGRLEDWIAEQAQAHAISESQFANPYIEAMAAREQLIRVWETVADRTPALQNDQSGALDAERRSRESRDRRHRTQDTGAVATIESSHWLKAIVLFTLPVKELAIDESLKDPNFSAMSIEYAVSRTVYHLPNLLRLTDQQRSILPQQEIEAMSARLEQEGQSRVSQEKKVATGGTAAAFQPLLRRKTVKVRSRFRWWWLPSIIIPIVILYFILRPATSPNSGFNEAVDSSPPRHANTDVVLVLPQEVQLFISAQVYKTRVELDQALAHGEGERILPSSQNLVITLDSAGFAKGVYGYFKVDNTWRKGKLLQAFHTNDTIKIDNFLPPLP